MENKVKVKTFSLANYLEEIYRPRCSNKCINKRCTNVIHYIDGSNCGKVLPAKDSQKCLNSLKHYVDKGWQEVAFKKKKEDVLTTTLEAVLISLLSIIRLCTKTNLSVNLYKRNQESLPFGWKQSSFLLIWLFTRNIKRNFPFPSQDKKKNEAFSTLLLQLNCFLTGGLSSKRVCKTKKSGILLYYVVFV